MSNFHSNEWYFSHIKQYTHTHTSRHITESKTKTKTNKQHVPSTHLDLNRKPSHQVCTCAFVTATERCDCHCKYILNWPRNYCATKIVCAFYHHHQRNLLKSKNINDHPKLSISS